MSSEFCLQVQPDMDELTENAEDIAEEGEKKEEIKLGKLQYKVVFQNKKKTEFNPLTISYMVTNRLFNTVYF